MADRRFYSASGWLSQNEAWWNIVGGTPTISTDGTLIMNFGVDEINAAFSNQPSAGDISAVANLGAMHNLNVPSDGSWNNGEIRRFRTLSGVELFAKKTSSTTFIIRAEHSGFSASVDGTTSLTFGTDYDISMQRLTGSPFTFRLWIGNTLEIEKDSTLTGTTNTVPLIGTDQGTANGSFTVDEDVSCFTDTLERIDASTLDSQVIVGIDAPSPQHDEYVDDETLNPISGTKISHVDNTDAGSADPVDQNTWLEQPGEADTTYRQTFHTANITMSNVQCVNVFQYGQANIDEKSLIVFSISADGTNKEEGGSTTSTSEDFITGRTIFARAPDGGAWTQDDLNDFQFGTRYDTPDEAVTWRLNVIYAEAMGCDFISTAEDNVVKDMIMPVGIIPFAR